MGENGGGIIVESVANSIDLTFKCKNDGEISILLKGKDERDKNRKRFPIYIDYTNLKLNGENIITKNMLTWHDNPYEYKKKVVNEEEINIHVEWKPFDHQSIYEQ